jgi:hypothetical protein
MGLKAINLPISNKFLWNWSLEASISSKLHLAMKLIWLLFFVVYEYGALKCQGITDSIEVDSSTNSLKDVLQRKFPSLKYAYSNETQGHNYSGNWDIDGDGKADSVYFIGNHGAHVYYHLRIKLSTIKKVTDFDFISIDFPLLESLTFFKKNGRAGASIPQFVVGDFNQDTKPDIYINLDVEKTTIPVVWKSKGVTSRHLLLHFNHHRLIIENFKSP